MINSIEDFLRLVLPSDMPEELFDGSLVVSVVFNLVRYGLSVESALEKLPVLFAEDLVKRFGVSEGTAGIVTSRMRRGIEKVGVRHLGTILERFPAFVAMVKEWNDD